MREPAGSQTPLSLLRDLASAGASGELVAAAGSLEVHVYLDQGTVAWATSSRAPNALLRHLVEDCRIDRDALREVVDECRRTKRRFGETLVEWNVATHEQVRAALRAQIIEAVTSLGSHPDARALFLPRDIDYAEELTFELSEVLPDDGDDGTARRAGEIVEAIAVALPELEWAAIVDPAGVLARTGPQSGDDGRLRQVAACLAEAGADEVVVRSDLGALVGRAVEGASSWGFAAVSPNVNLGIASTVLATACGGVGPRSGAGAHAPTWTRSGSARLPGSERIEDAFARSDELVAAIGLEPGGAFDAVHRLGFDHRLGCRSATAIAPLLCGSIADYIAGARTSLGRLTYERIVVNVGCGPYWYYGTQLAGSARAFWTVMDRGAPRGFGWALLTSLVRELDAGRGEA